MRLLWFVKEYVLLLKTSVRLGTSRCFQESAQGKIKTDGGQGRNLKSDPGYSSELWLGCLQI